MNLTPEQVTALQSKKISYEDLGIQRNLFKPQPTQFRSFDELGLTVENVSGLIPVDALDLRDFIKKTKVVRITGITINDGQTALITMVLTMQTGSYNLVVPRFSIFQPTESLTNEIYSPEGKNSLTNVFVTSLLREQPSTNLAQKYFFTVSIQNKTGSSGITFAFKGEWLYFGEVIDLSSNVDIATNSTVI